MGCSHNLVFTKHHRHIRAAVYRRDNFSCVRCGATAEHVPADYDGRSTLATDRKSRDGFTIYLCVDHIVSRRNGGSNQIENLQTLCDSCNARKASTTDRKGVA